MSSQTANDVFTYISPAQFFAFLFRDVLLAMLVIGCRNDRNACACGLSV